MDFKLYNLLQDVCSKISCEPQQGQFIAIQPDAWRQVAPYQLELLEELCKQVRANDPYWKKN